MKTYSSIISLALFLVGTALLAGCGGGGDSGAFFIPAPVAKAQPAETVIGQATFSSYSSLADPTYSRDIAAYTNDGSFGSPVVSTAGSSICPIPTPTGCLAITPSRLPTVPAPTLCWGSPPLHPTVPASGANRMNYPQSVRTAASGKLFVTDYNNNRILVWNTAPTTTGVPANLVVGQPGFGSTTELPANSDLVNPEDMFVVGSKLIVADSGNNRILIWNTIPTASGTPADIVLGQNCPIEHRRQ